MNLPAVLVLTLRLMGISQVALSLLHLAFPRRFQWREELAAVSLLTREIFYVHTFFVCLVVAGMGALCAVDPGALLARSRLGAWVAGGGALFWAARLYIQWFVYSASHWRGHRFEFGVHVGFSALWAGYTVIFGACLAYQGGWMS